VYNISLYLMDWNGCIMVLEAKKILDRLKMIEYQFYMID
jgi:hypothetical protein